MSKKLFDFWEYDKKEKATIFYFRNIKVGTVKLDQIIKEWLEWEDTDFKHENT